MAEAQYDPTTDPAVKWAIPQPQEQTQQSTPETSQVPYDPTTDPDVQFSKPLSAVYRQVMDSDATQNAKVQNLASKSGMTPQTVSQNPNAVDKAVNGPTPDSLDNLAQTHPVTAQFLSDPKNMASAHNQIPALQKSESGWQDFEKSSMNALAEVLKYDVQNTPFEQGGIGPLSWNADDVKNLTDKLQTGADAIASPDMNADALAEYKKGNKKPLEAQIISSIPNLAKTVAQWINPEVGIASTINESAGQAFDSAKEAGLFNEKALTSGIVKGTIDTGTTMLTMGLLHKLYAPLAESIGHISARDAIQKGIVANLTTNAAFMTQGQIQDLSHAYVNTLTGEDPKAFDKFKENFATNLAVGTAQGIMLTALPLAHLVITKGPEAIKEGPQPPNRRASDKGPEGKPPDEGGSSTQVTPDLKGKSDEEVEAEGYQNYQEKKADITKKAFQTALDNSKDVKLNTDNPIQAKEHQDAIGDQYGGKTVHIPSEVWQELHQDDAPKIAEELGPEFKKSYDQAQETGGTVHGPLSDVLANADKVKAGELADHVKFGNDPTDKTVTEAKESRDELETAQKETEEERKTALANFEQSIKGKIENVGGKASEGAGTQAKGIAKVLDNLSKTINVPISKLLQLYKFRILKEPKPVGELSERDKFNNHYQQAQDMGIATAADYVKKEGHLIYVPREEGESKEAWKARTRDAGKLVKVTDDPNSKTGMTYQQFAEDIGNAYTSKEITDSGLPREWFDENGQIQKPDASKLDDVLSIIANSGSGVEGVEKMEAQFQEYHQSGIDPFGLSKEDEKDIFGNVIKPNKAQQEFPDTFVKPNDKAVDQDMFPTAKGKKGEEKPQQELFQGHRGRTLISGQAGEPGPRDFHTYVAAGADQSTMFHEFAHNFLQIFRDHVGQEDATPEAKDMEAKILKWFGVDKWDDVTDRHSEMFARGFEYRLWEGKSPTGLQKIFQTFANWLRKIYPSSDVMSGYLKSVGATMTDEMRGVYDRFIASSDEIQRAEKEMGYKTKAPEGLSAEEFNEWKSKQDSATQKAMDALNSRKMEWLKKDKEEQIGKEKVIAEKKAEEDVDKLPIFQAKDALEHLVTGFEGKSKEMAEKYLDGKADPITSDAIQHIADQHGFQTAADLAYGLANSDRQSEIKNRVDAHMQEFTPKVNGSADEIQTAMLKGEERSQAIATEGALIKKLIADFKSNELKAKMEKAQGDQITSIANKKQEPLTKEQANANRQKALEQARKDQAVAKARATEIMADATLKDARGVRSYLADMKNAAKKSQQFQDKGNLEKASEWKDKQLLNHELAMQAVKNRDFITRSIKALQNMGKIEKKPLQMPFGHWMQIKNVLESFGMKQPKPIQEYTFKKIAQDMLNDGKTNAEIADATGMVADDNGKLSKETLQQFKQRVMDSNAQLGTRINVPGQMSLKDMTLGDLRNIKNSLEAIYKHGRDADNLTLAGKKMSFKYWKAQALEAVANARGKKVTVQTPDGPQEKTVYRHDIDVRDPAASKWTGTEDVINHLLNIGDYKMGYIRQFPRIANELDGGDKGPWNGIIDTLMDSATTKKTLEDERSTLQREIMSKYYSPKEQEDLLSKELPAIQTTKGTLKPTKTMARAVYEYCGTQGGLDYLKTGLGYTDEDLMKYKNLLDKKDLDFIHEYNEKLVQSNWSKYVAKEMELNHVEPKPNDYLPVETKHGIRTGVYRPLIADRLRSKGLSQEDQETNLKSGYQEAAGFSPFSTQVNKSFLKERSGVKGIAPDLSDLVWQRYHEQTENYMAYQGALKEINKINNDTDIQQVLKRALGANGAKLFKTQTDYVSVGDAVRRDAFEKVAGTARNSVIGSSIGYRVPLFFLKSMTDATNLFFGEHGGLDWAGSQLRNGVAYFGISIPKSDGTSMNVGVGGPGMKSLIEKVNGMSVDMRHQNTNFDWNARNFSKDKIFTHLDNILGKTARLIQNNKLVRFVGLNTYMMERSADAGMRYPAWMLKFQYEKVNGLNDHDAMRQANKYTNNKLSTADSLWNIGPMRGGELSRQVSPVLSFPANQFNQFLDVYNKNANNIWKNGVNMKPGAKVALALACAGGAMQFFVAPAIYKTALNVATGKTKWDKDLPKELGWEAGSETANGIPYGGYAFNALRSWITSKNHHPETDLPVQNYAEGNWEGLNNLHKLGLDEMSEDAWNKEFTAFSDDTSFPKTVQTVSMNFVDHLNRQDDWQLKDFFRKREYLGAKSEGGI